MIKLRLLLIATLLICHAKLLGQGLDTSVVASSTLDSSSSLIMYAENLFHTVDELTDREIDTLYDNVTLIQDSVFMSCDFAVVKDQIDAYATGNIAIVQNDSIFIYADTLVYNGLLKIAVLTGEVILESKGKLLNTSKLIYNVNDKRATFHEGAKLIDELSTLDSKEGSYDVNRQVAHFRYNVRYQDTTKILLSDSLQYNYSSSRLTFESPTNIYQDSTTIYAESGVYDTKIDKGILSQNVQVSMIDRDISAGILVYEGATTQYRMYIDPVIYENTGAIARGDSILYNSNSKMLDLLGNASYVDDAQDISSDVISYDQATGTYTTKGRSKVYQDETFIEAEEIFKEVTGEIIAAGAVLIRDTIARSTILCDRVLRVDSTGLSKAFGLFRQPYVIYELESNDSLILKADTLLSFTQDSIDLFSAYHNVSFVKGDVVGRADSITFNSADSIFVLYDNPILWSDSTQLSADTISMILSGGDIRAAYLKQNAFIIEQDEDDKFNQVSGLKIDCSFRGQSLDEAYVDGNSKLIYFIRDEEEELKGVNSTLSSKMKFSFVENEIDNIRFFNKPESEIFENKDGIDFTIFKIEGFKWRLNEKPALSNFVIYQ